MSAVSSTTGNKTPVSGKARSPNAGGSKQRRGEIAIAAQGYEPVEWLAWHFGQLCKRARGASDLKKRAEYEAEARSLGLALLPYSKPRLKAVELKIDRPVNVTVEIGGDE